MATFDGFPVIAHDNVFSRAGVIVTDPSETTGFPASRLYDKLTTAYAWKPDGLSATEDLIADLGVSGTIGGRMAFGLIGHNLADESVSVEVSHSPNGSSWTSVFSYAPSDNRNVIFSWDQVWRRYMRVRFSGITAATLQVTEAWLGQAVVMPDSLAYNGFERLGGTTGLELSRAEDSGEPVRAKVAELQRTAGARFSWVPVPVLRYDDQFRGFDYWLNSVADAGKPFLWHWAGSIQSEFRFDGFVAQLQGEVSEELASRIDDGYRQVSIQLTGAAV
jgi:hypothetical protein